MVIMRRKKTKNKKRSAILEITTKSNRETKELGALLAKTIVFFSLRTQLEQHQMLLNKRRGALVLSLEGDLGSGKTTFAKGFAEGLGIREIIQSPTFVIVKIYKIIAQINIRVSKKEGKRFPLPACQLAGRLTKEGIGEVNALRQNHLSRATSSGYKNLIHVDAYRIGSKDLPAIGLDEFIKNPSNIILIEWGDRITKALPKSTFRVVFRHAQKYGRIIGFV